jgi:hypothetical protein
MIIHKEDYKGHEIHITDTGKGWNYRIPNVLGSRPSTLYSKRETALQIAKGVIDHLMTP